MGSNKHEAASELKTERQRSEEALRGSEERYRQLFELCPDAVIVQCEGKIELINTAGAHLLGAEHPEQIIGTAVMDFVHPDYRQAVLDRMASLRQGGSVALMEQKILRRDGTSVDVEVTSGMSVLRDRPAMQVIIRDIRKRKRLEFQNAQITQLSHRLNSAATARDAALIIVETADTLLGWQACELTLYSPEQDKIYSLVTMDEVAGRRQHVPPVNDGCPPTPIKRRLLHEGGCLIPCAKDKRPELGLRPFGDTARPSASLLFAPIRDGSRVIGFLSIQSYKDGAYSKEDLNLLQFLGDHCGGALERLRVQEALRESEQRFHAFMDHSPVVAFIRDEAGHYVYGNKAWARQFQRPPAELYGKTEFDLWPEALARRSRESDAAVFATGEPTEILRSIPGLDGVTRSWIVIRFLIPSAAGERLLGGLALDVTERRQAEEELNRSRAQLRSLAAHLQSIREEERIRIAREIHDELGQLLTGFKMDLSWLDKRMIRPPDEMLRVRLADKICAMSAMVDDMVDSVRRISAELRPGILDALGLVPAMEWQTREFQKRAGIECQLDSSLEANHLPPELCTAIFRIFQETMTNIARHSGATRVKISLDEAEGCLVMRIEDNGRGITEAEMAAPQSLGLAGMRERALGLGGEFRITSAPGAGTAASVSIPLGRAEANG